MFYEEIRSYRQLCIISYSWHNSYAVYTNSLIAVVTIIAVAYILYCVILKLRNRDNKILKTVLKTVAVYVLCLVALIACDLLVADKLWSNDYDPAYYEFSYGNNTMVIEEKSLLLYGAGTVYQVSEDGSAVKLAGFTTDDGGRNNGNYGIFWKSDGAEITYRTFADDNSEATLNVQFKY